MPSMVRILLTILFGAFGSLFAQGPKPVTAELSLRASAIEQFEPLYVGVKLTNRSKVAVRIFWRMADCLDVEQLVDQGKGGGERWIGLLALRRPVIMDVSTRDSRPCRVRIQAGVPGWIQKRIWDQSLLMVPGLYRVRFSGMLNDPSGKEIVKSPWTLIRIKKNAKNLAVIGGPTGAPNPLGLRRYRCVMRLRSGFKPIDPFKTFGLKRSAVKSDLVAKVLGPRDSLEWLSRQRVSSALGDHVSVLRAQQLISEARILEGKSRSDVLRRADTLLAACKLDQYKCVTGGLGAQILWTRALIAYELGQRTACAATIDRIKRRYSGDIRPGWAHGLAGRK